MRAASTTASEARSAELAGARSASPRAVTRGESPQAAETQAAKIDWLHATFDEPSMSPEGFVGMLGAILGRPVSAILGGGLMGFKESLRLFAHVGSRQCAMGFIAKGGESQNGRWLLQLTGGGCGLIDDWGSVEQLLEDLEAKITRVDLAVDFLDGEWGVDDAVGVYQAGGFSGSGRPPSHSLAGDWLGGTKGRTLYVGKSTHGKMLRVYEKGRQLGNEESDWCRFEVQLGNRDRVIPYDVLTSPDKYFAGAYPALADILEDVVAEKIETVQASGMCTLAHIVHHLKRSYGKAIDVACNVFGATHDELVEEVRVIGVPRRLQPSALSSGLTWAQLIAHIRE